MADSKYYTNFYDLAVKHQLLLELLKNHYVKENRKLVRELGDNARRLMAGISYQNLGDMTKNELIKLVRKLREMNVKIYDIYISKLIADLEAFMTLEAETLSEAYARGVSTFYDEEPDEEAAAFIASFEATSPALARRVEAPQADDTLMAGWWLGALALPSLWAQFRNAPMASLGLTPIEAIKRFQDYSNTKIINQLRASYASRSSKDEFISSIFGPPSRNAPSGLFHSLDNNFSALVKTLFQAGANGISGKLNSIVSKTYRYCAIIDNNTTQVCRGLHGNYFEYGSGPIPPLHVQCRSFIIPDTVKGNFYGSIEEWLKNQPDGVIKQWVAFSNVDIAELRKQISDATISPAKYRKTAEFMANA